MKSEQKNVVGIFLFRCTVAFSFHVIAGKYYQHDDDRDCHDNDEEVREIIEVLVYDSDAPDIISEDQESPAPECRTDKIEYYVPAVIHRVYTRDE